MTENIASLLGRTILGNTVQVWLIALGFFIGVLLALVLARISILRILKRAAGKTKTQVDDIVSGFLEEVPGWTWTMVALLVALRIPVLPSIADRLLSAGLFIALTIFGVLLVLRLVTYLLLEHVPRFKESGRTTLPSAMQVTLSVVLWAIGVLMILSNIGVNVLSLVAGLGIGGIAVALAAQNILGDMFSSYSLYFDEPFKEGDFIIVGQHKGIVKKVGLKTTRIQALEGEEVVISNQELTSTRVQNYKRMRERRVVFPIGVTYDTPVAKLKAIPGWIKDIIESQKDTRVDRVHFFGFGDFSLNIEIVYFMTLSDYNTYMDTRQAINLAIMEKFEKEGVAFAFPTQTIQLEKAA